MRKGAKRRDWTVADLQFLRDNAGKIPRRELSRALKRGARAIESQVYLMRKSGEDVTLRCFRSRLVRFFWDRYAERFSADSSD